MRFADFKTIETSRLILREIRMEDIQEYYERLWGDGDVCRYLLHDPHQDIGKALPPLKTSCGNMRKETSTDGASPKKGMTVLSASLVW